MLKYQRVQPLSMPSTQLQKFSLLCLGFLTSFRVIVTGWKISVILQTKLKQAMLRIRHWLLVGIHTFSHPQNSHQHFKQENDG